MQDVGRAEVRRAEEEGVTEVRVEEALKEQLSEPQFCERYEEACKILEGCLNEMNREKSVPAGRSYINKITWRVKSPESCIAKLKRKGLSLSRETAEERLNDIAGVRVVCSFLDDMYALCREMAEKSGYKLIKQKDYVKKPKASGYQSLHLILRVPVKGGRAVKAEVQFRTQAMDFWAGVEHHFVYKKDGEHNKELEADLRKCARTIYKVDKKMMEIRNKM